MIYIQYQKQNADFSSDINSDPITIDPIFAIIHIIVICVFLIGFILSIRRYKKKKNVNSLIVGFLMLQGLLIALGGYIVFFTNWFQLIPFFSFFGIFAFILALIVLNIRLEKRVEERTKEIEISEEKYQNLVLNITDIIVELNSELTIIYITPQIKDLLNYKPHEMLNRKLTEFIHPDELV
ncbi:MAG: hypothetical protein ACFFCM_18195, partial [Promethearchaeota archaeon]